MPDLLRLADALELPADKYGRKLKPIIALVDSVHRLPKIAKIKVVMTRNKNNEGEYHYKMGTFEPNFIEISEINDSIEATLLHEIGHFLELALIPGCAYAQRQWSSDPLTSTWLEIIKSSKTFKILQQIHDTGACYRHDQQGVAVEKVPVNRDWVAYLATPRELWARSYAQWVVSRGKNDELKSFFKKLSSPTAAVPLQWTGDEFAAIEEQFDKIFAAIGWLK